MSSQEISRGTSTGGGIGRLGMSMTTFAIVAVPILVAGCDITNPGPVQNEFLLEQASHPALVHGGGKALVQALNPIVLTTAYLSREVFPTGTIGPGSPGAQVLQRALIDDGSTAGSWNALHTARYVAEHGISILTDGDGDPALIAQARVYAGFANKILGETFCQVTFDGGPIEPPSAALQRAEQHFTAAIETSSGNLQLQARAGRAQTRAALGEWAAAAADAASVPIDFSGGTIPTDGIVGAAGVQNNTWMVVAAVPYRGHTIRFTFFDEYFTETGDPRAAWESVPAFQFGNSQLQGYGPVPFTRQKAKNNAPGAPYRLTSGHEMRLIEAEAILHQTPGNWPAALALINAVRTRVTTAGGEPLAPYTASSLAETWSALMTERRIELWQEGKRMADLRRWTEEGVPGVDSQFPDWRPYSPGFFAEVPSRCFPIPQSEQRQNPHIEEGECIGCGVQFGSGQSG